MKAANPGYRAIIEPSFAQVKKMWDLGMAGRYSEAVGHGLAGVVPGIGPVVAGMTDTATGEPTMPPGQNIEDPHPGEPIRALGQGVTATLLGLIGRGSPVQDAAGNALRSSAADQLYRVLGPTTNENKSIAAKIVPQLLDRGITANSRAGLLEKFLALKDDAGNAVESAWNNLPPGTQVPLAPILDTMNQHAARAFLSETGRPTSAPAQAALGIVNDLGQRLAAESTRDATGQPVITPAALRQYRQEFDRVANKGGAFTASIDDGTQAGAHAIAGNAIRAAVSDQFPDIAKANKEYSLWKDAADVYADTRQRQIGQSPSLGRQFARSAGQIGGFLHGGPVGAALGGELLARGAQAARAPWYATRAAAAKYSLGDVLKSGTPTPFALPGLLGNTSPAAQPVADSLLQ
ncbi:MAG TPA: hypothetical protein VGR73_20540 [Bryobacteraceae bacterium]|nr:hypothetical protein [Bryobacteraceae bacterium]